MLKYAKTIIISLLLLVGGSLFLHNLHSIDQDIGRHIKLGEIILKTHTVPKTNLFSFTEPNYPFINHHWLSEVVLYLLFISIGLKGIIIFKAAILLIAFALLLHIIRKNQLWSIIVSTLLSLFVFFERTDVRPEMFSFLFLAIFLFILYRVRSGESKSSLLWILPLIEVLWVNIHIYFVIGIFVYGCFIVEYFFLKRLRPIHIMYGIVLLLATLINPNGLTQALYPFTILRDYGYDVVENGSIFHLINYLHVWPFQIKIFWLSFVILVASFIASFRTIKHRIFPALLAIGFSYLGMSMLRNLGLYAIATVPILSDNLNSIPWRIRSRTAIRIFHASAIACLCLISYTIVTNAFYKTINTSSRFGLAIPQASMRAIDFVKQNHLQGNLFNNFDIGSFLIWQLYPDQKVFTDGRPEAYPVSFWKEIYKPMQMDYALWQKKSVEYGINYVFFSHRDLTPWHDNFLQHIVRDKDWPIVFFNEDIVIFVRRTSINEDVIGRYAITKDTIASRLDSVLATFDTKDDLQYRDFGRFLYRMGYYEASAYVYDHLVTALPGDAYGYQGKAYSLAGIGSREGYTRALPMAEKAIELGLDTADNYVLLAVIQGNLGDREGAQQAADKAFALDPTNVNAIAIKKQLLKP